MTLDEIAAVKAEHEPDDRSDPKAWCMACANAVAWPCLPYRLAVEAEHLAGKVDAALEYLSDSIAFEDAVNDSKGGNDDRARGVIAALRQIESILEVTP